jgi:hypothetical protein
MSPQYEYFCGSNGRTLEVRHSMDEHLETWGELTARAGTEPGDTRSDAPVTRLLSAPVPMSGPGPQAGPQGCGTGCACAAQRH